MAWQSSTINPATTSPATDISKLTNDLSVLRSVLGGGTDADVPTKFTPETSSTGSAVLPSGTTAQRDVSPATGYLRYNSSTGAFEGYGSSGWGSIGGGAVGGGSDAAMYENDLLVTSSYTVGQGAMQSCTISIASPAVITQSNNYVAGQPVRFTTSGALPTGLSTGSVYYVLASGLSTSSFKVSATVGGSAVNTSGTQSGSHNCGKVKSASMTGPLTLASGVAVTVPTGARLVVL